MKTNVFFRNVTSFLALATGAAFAASPGNPSVLSQIAAKPVFTSPIEWVGAKQPSESESATLLQAIQQFETSGTTAGFNALEQFLSAQPDSTWAPSLHVNMAEYY